MKFYTSYFYNIRFFDSYMIPMSTAVWDPGWFHQFKGKKHIWKDANGVYNGIRIEELNPEKCNAHGCPCEFQKTDQGYKYCRFLREYKEGLNKIDFDKLIYDCTKLANYIKEKDKLLFTPAIVFIFHESPDNPCSERVPVQELFKSHGIEITEWSR